MITTDAKYLTKISLEYLKDFFLHKPESVSTTQFSSHCTQTVLNKKDNFPLMCCDAENPFVWHHIQQNKIIIRFLSTLMQEYLLKTQIRIQLWFNALNEWQDIFLNEEKILLKVPLVIAWFVWRIFIEWECEKRDNSFVVHC